MQESNSSQVIPLECDIHKGSPIMFVCLDNFCNEKLHCFKCCQQQRNKHNFVKFTDFLLNLDSYLISSLPSNTELQQQQQSDQNPTLINSTSCLDDETKNENNKKKQQQNTQIDRKSSMQQEDDENLIIQCVKGMNQDFRNGKIWEECEEAKDQLKSLQIQYIDKIFDKQVQEFMIMLDKARETIINKYSEYVDNMLNVSKIINKESEKKACKIVSDASKSNSLTTSIFNENLYLFHQGEFHIQQQKEKIALKVNELNHKLDEFFPSIHNRITFSLNSCQNVFQPKSTNHPNNNTVSSATIQKIFANNKINKSKIPQVDFRFQLRQHLNHHNNNNNVNNDNKNNCKIIQNSQQSSLLSSMQNSGIGSRISFRIKNMAQKKLDNFLSLSPPHNHNHNHSSNKPPQGFQLINSKNNTLKIQYSNAFQQSNSGSPKNQKNLLFKANGNNKVIKQQQQQNFISQENSKGDEDFENINHEINQKNEEKIQNSFNKCKIITEPTPTNRKSHNINEQTKNIVNAEIKIIDACEQNEQSNELNNSSMKFDVTEQLELIQQSEEVKIKEYPNINTPTTTHSLHSKPFNKFIPLTNTNNNNNNNKFGLMSEYYPIKQIDNQQNNNNMLRSQQAEKNNNKLTLSNTDMEINQKNQFEDHLSKSALLKQTIHLKYVVQNQKQQIKLNGSKDNLIVINKQTSQQILNSITKDPEGIVSTLFPEESQSSTEFEQAEEDDDNELSIGQNNNNNNNYPLFNQHNIYNNNNNLNQNNKQQGDITRNRFQSSYQSGQQISKTHENY